LMNQTVFDYYAIYPTAEKIPPPGGLICSEDTNGPTRTVLGDHIGRVWTFDGAAGARFLYDEEKQERAPAVSRTAAERIAREVFGTVLPSVAELHRICDEAETIPQRP
jgi:hypothetical protein